MPALVGAAERPKAAGEDSGYQHEGQQRTIEIGLAITSPSLLQRLGIDFMQVGEFAALALQES